MLKKIYKLIPVLTIIMLVLAGCTSVSRERSDGKYTVCCTVFPGYDWARACIGDDKDIELIYLLDDGEDMHSYQPSVSDIACITEADMFIYVGGPSDEWVLELLDSNSNPDQIRVCMMDVLSDSIKEEEIVEGMQADEEEAEQGEIEYDEHVWLSFDNASIVVSYIADALGTMNEAGREQYITRAKEYASRLNDMRVAYEGKMAGRTKDTIIVADRFPFRYLVDEFGVKYYAAFPGCSAESESSFETIVFLIEKARECEVGNIYIIENADDKLASTIADNCPDDIDILVLDSMQSVTVEDIEAGASYIGYMTDNMEALLTGLL